MKVIDLISTMKEQGIRIEIRDSDDREIGTFPQGSGGLAPYMDRTVLAWYPEEVEFNKTVVVCIKEDGK